MARALAASLVFAVCAGAAGAAKLPGVKTPSRNIRCFYVPQRPTVHGMLLCNIREASYTGALQHRCIDGEAGLDWHGFSLSETRKAAIVCTGGVMYDEGRDTPTFVVLAYGRSWRYKQFTCVSRVTGLTCTNRGGHGLFLSRASYRLF